MKTSLKAKAFLCFCTLLSCALIAHLFPEPTNSVLLPASSFSVSNGTSKFVDSRSWPRGTTKEGQDSLWCQENSPEDPRCLSMRESEVKGLGYSPWFTRSEVADSPAWTGRDVPTDWIQYPTRLASEADLERMETANRDNELNSDWTEYPYDAPSYADGDGLFGNHENAENKATAPSDSEDPANFAADRYSYFWPVDNSMGYPDGSIPARRTYEFDLSTGGRSYEDFWGGQDPVSIGLEARAAWLRDSPNPQSFPDADLSDYKSFWDKPAPGPTNEDERLAEAGLWARDLDLGNGVRAMVDPDEGDGAGDGLLRVYRASYAAADGPREYDKTSWQRPRPFQDEGDALAAAPPTAAPVPAGPAELPEAAARAEWPRALFGYAAAGTPHDLRGGEVRDAASGELADPLDDAGAGPPAEEVRWGLAALGTADDWAPPRLAAPRSWAEVRLPGEVGGGGLERYVTQGVGGDDAAAVGARPVRPACPDGEACVPAA